MKGIVLGRVMKRRITKICGLAVVLAASALTPSDSWAGYQVFNTIAGGTDSAGEPVNASASFTTRSNSITINLQNLIVNQRSIGQNLSDLLFTVSGSPSSAAITSSASTTRDVAANGTYTDSPTPTSTGWALTMSGGTIHLNGLAGGVYTPSHTLIGLPDPSTNTYSNGNSSLLGNGPHNPYLTNPTIFTLNVQGVTDATTISSVQFSFGTQAGNNVNGTSGPPVSPAPEPASLTMLCTGLVGLMGYAWKRRKKWIA
jgi:hypothetical protein